MTDEFDKFAKALRAAAPPPDSAAKAEAIRLAMENFERHQGTAAAVRPISDRPSQAGILSGVRTMLQSLTSRRALAATTSIAALCLGLVVVLPQWDATPRPGLSDAPPPVEADREVLAEVAPPPAVMPAPAPPSVLARRAPPQTEAPHATKRAIAPDAVASLPLAPAADALGAAAEYAPTMPEARLQEAENTEEFANAPDNPVKVTAEEPVSTFSVDVDTASYAIIRSSLENGYLPDPQSVRIEEMVNYFPYAYPAPEPGEAPFRATVTVMPAPWNEGRKLVQIGLQGRLPALADRPPLNLVFLVDTSGSMQDTNKLPLLKQSLRLVLPQLRPEDQVAIVAYAGSAGEVLPPTPATDSATILAALDRLEAGGSTAGAEGLELAYRVADRMSGAGEVGRILLATDGDFNVGIDDPEGLEAYVAKKRGTGTYLSVLGFGRGNLDDATMQALAQAGNGLAAYIDTAQEARKVLVDQLTGALFPIADDVKIQVEWNPATVAEYRLIGYETRALRREDFNNDRVDAGEIGAGHSVTAIYEITPPGSPALAMDPLRYGTATTTGTDTELGFLRLRWKAPGEDTSTLSETPILPEMAAPGEDARFAAAIAGMGQLLTGATYLGTWGWDDAIALALTGRGADPFGYRVEAVNLMRLAKTMSQQ